MRTLWPTTALLLLSYAAPARAQQPSADDLFREGVQLFGRGETAAACERFSRSYKLEPAPGTLYNLAGCHEKQGELWLARQEYLDLADRATKAGKPDKANLARERLAALEAKLPRIQLVFPSPSNVETIVVDREPLASGAWRAPVLVSPGAHTVEFRAKGRSSILKTLDANEATPVNIEVPLLTDDPTLAPVAPPPPPTPREPAATPPPPREANDNSADGSQTRTIGFVTGGAGVVALGLGAYFGLRAASLKSDATDACGNNGGRVCPTDGKTQAAQTKLDDARTSALVSTIAVGAGVAAVAVGIYLIATSSPTPSRARTGVWILPTVGVGSGGLSLGGAL